MNIAVVEDNRQEMDLLLRLLNEYGEENALDLMISPFSYGEDFIASLDQKDYEVVFLDIFLNKMDGMEAAGLLWEHDPGCLIIFLTSSREHIWQAARIHCFDYIDKKDFSRQRIFEVLTDVRRKLPETNQYLEFLAGNLSVRLPMRKIQHILSDNNYTIFRMEEGSEYRYRIPFRSILELTGQVDYFLNCNRGILLNMNSIIKEETDVYVMKGGQRFPIRRFERAAIKDIYHQYQFKKLEEM